MLVVVACKVCSRGPKSCFSWLLLKHSIRLMRACDARWKMSSNRPLVSLDRQDTALYVSVSAQPDVFLKIPAVVILSFLHTYI